MLYNYVGIATVVIAVGFFFTVYRNRNQASVDLPALRNNSGNRRNLNEQFIAWIERKDSNGVGTWIRSLEQKERILLLREVEAFCKDANFQLPWLIDQQIEDVPLREHLEASVLRFLQACREASVVQEELRLYVTLVKLLNNAERRRYRPKIQAVYLQLANMNIIPDADTNLLFKKNRHRWQHAAEAIAIASRNERETVNQVIRHQVLGEPIELQPAAAR